MIKKYILLFATLLLVIATAASCGDDSNDTDIDTKESAIEVIGSVFGDDSTTPVETVSDTTVETQIPESETDIESQVTEKEETNAPQTEPETYIETKPVHQHIYVLIKTVQATCTADGYSLESCDCGDIKKTNVVKASGHDYDNWVTDKEATCLSTGSKSRTCSKCNHKEKKTLAIVKHSYAKPTCTKPEICIWCKTAKDLSEPLFHKWSAANWTNGGKGIDGSTAVYTCSVCGTTKTIELDTNIPQKLIDTPIMRSLAYIGYDVEGQIKDGTLFRMYGPFELTRQYFSKVFYDEFASTGPEGYETVADPTTVTGYAPNLALFNKKGLVCASFTTYYLFNYMPNIEGYDVSEFKKAFDATKLHYRGAVTWRTALESMSVNNPDLVKKIGTSMSNVNRSVLTPGDVFLFRNEKYTNSHVAIYAGTYNGEDYVIHCTSWRGVEINTLSKILDPYEDGSIEGSHVDSVYHLNLSK